MHVNINKVKIFVTIPTKSVNAVRDAVCKEGAGVIGNYSFCTFSSNGLGTFVPNEAANPHIGTNGRMERVEEAKLEFICEVSKVKQVLKALRKVHPYEEPAIDIIPLIDESEFD